MAARSETLCLSAVNILKWRIWLAVIRILAQDPLNLDPDPEYQTLVLYHVGQWDQYILLN